MDDKLTIIIEEINPATLARNEARHKFMGTLNGTAVTGYLVYDYAIGNQINEALWGTGHATTPHTENS